MTVLEVLKTFGAVSGAISGSYLLWKEARETEQLRKWRLKQDMKKNRPFNLNQNLHFVPKQSVDEALKKGFADPYGGVQVLYAPSGSGKSSYLKHALAQNKGRPALYISKFTSAKEFYSHLYMKGNELVSDFVPENSVIVIDQMEQTLLTAEVRSAILHLATDSRGSAGKYNVIMCFSNAEAARQVLLLNGMDKIFPMCDRSVFHWGGQDIKKFCEHACVNWKPEQIERLESLALTAKCPGFLQNVLHLFPQGIPLDDEKAMKDLELSAIHYHEKWDESLHTPTPRGSSLSLAYFSLFDWLK